MSEIIIDGNTGCGSGSYFLDTTPTKVVNINNFRETIEIQNQDSESFVRLVAMPIQMTEPPDTAPSDPTLGSPTRVPSVLLAPGQTWSPNSEQVPENAFYAYTIGTGSTAIISIMEG